MQKKKKMRNIQKKKKIKVIQKEKRKWRKEVKE